MPIPFVIGVMADFSGRSSGDVLEIDPDTFEGAFSRLEVDLRFRLDETGGPEVRFSPAGLDDFHPDRLFSSLTIFESSRKLRSRLEDPETFDVAAAQVRSWAEEPEVGIDAGQEPALTGEDRDRLDLMEEILASNPEGRRKGVKIPGVGDLDEFMRGVVSRHVEPDEDPEQDEMIAGLDAAISEQMRSLLHHPKFRALESTWRSLHWLMAGIETGSELKLFAIDISREKFTTDLFLNNDLESSDCYRLLAESPWAVLVGDYRFEYTVEDARLLERVAGFANLIGAPFLASASPTLLGCESLAGTADPDDWNLPSDKNSRQAWERLRSLPEASHIGLCLPRFLMRTPYGERTDPIGSFTFEELADSPAHEEFLWANSAFACARLLGSTFNHDGWHGLPGDRIDLDDLPSCTYTDGGEKVLKPCAEVWLSERAIQAIRTTGLMPLVGFRDTNRARLGGFRSLSVHSKALAGRWSR